MIGILLAVVSHYQPLFSLAIPNLRYQLLFTTVNHRFCPLLSVIGHHYAFLIIRAYSLVDTPAGDVQWMKLGDLGSRVQPTMDPMPFVFITS